MSYLNKREIISMPAPNLKTYVEKATPYVEELAKFVNFEHYILNSINGIKSNQKYLTLDNFLQSKFIGISTQKPDITAKLLDSYLNRKALNHHEIYSFDDLDSLVSTFKTEMDITLINFIITPLNSFEVPLVVETLKQNCLKENVILSQSVYNKYYSF